MSCDPKYDPCCGHSLPRPAIVDEMDSPFYVLIHFTPEQYISLIKRMRAARCPNDPPSSEDVAKFLLWKAGIITDKWPFPNVKKAPKEDFAELVQECLKQVHFVQMFEVVDKYFDHYFGVNHE